MNQSYGNREYVISEQQWNDIKRRLNNAMISNNDFLAFNPNNIKNSVLFLDPPYVNREMTYNKNGFSINNFINWITELNDNNLILYTDFENSVSDNLVNFGFKKIKLRTMISTSPNRKSGVEEDKLKDDIDSDKDYWKKQYSELEEKFKKMETEFSSCKEELQTYKVKEDKVAMQNYLHSFRKCFNEEDLKVMASKIENSQRCEFEKEVDEKVKEFARKMSECDDHDDEDVEIKNSCGFMANINDFTSTNESEDELEKIIKKYKK